MTETNSETKTEYTGPDSHPGQFWVDGKLVAGAEDEDAARAILASVGASEDPPAAPRRVAGAYFRSALIEKGLIDTVRGAITDPVKLELFNTATDFNDRDADVTAIATALDIDLSAVFDAAEAIRAGRS